MYKAILVDDESQIRKGLSMLIPWDEYGIEIAGQAENGKSALDLIRSINPDIAIIDIRMPVMDGLDLLRSIRDAANPPKCIMLSGYDQFDYVKAAMRLGALNYLLKPVDAEELSITVRETVNLLDDEANKKQQFNQTLESLKNNILNRVIHGRIDVRELREKCELIGISLRCNNMYVAIVHPIFDNQDVTLRYIMFESLRICQSEAELIDISYSFADEKDNIVIIIKDPHHRLNAAKLHSIIESCSCQIAAELHLNCICAIGGNAASYKDLPKAWQIASQRISNDLFWQGCELPPADSSDIRDASIPDEDTIIALLQTGNKDDLHAFVRDFFRRSYRSASEENPIAIRFRVIEFSIRALQAARKCCLSDADQEALRSQLYRTLQGDLKVHELESAVLHLMQEIKERISDDGIAGYSHRVQYVIRYIYENYGDCNLSLKTLASDLNVNSAYLGRQFSTETGEFFSDCLNRIRIFNAQRLLSDTTLRINDIAQRVGFPNISYFSTLYKKITGETPAQSRSPEKE